MTDGVPRHVRYINSIREQLFDGECARLARWVLDDMLPHYWREEASNPEEWFIRTCRGLGLHVTYDLGKEDFILTRTRDIAHEATITWPGKAPHVPR